MGKFKLGDKVISNSEIQELVKGYNLKRSMKERVKTVVMVGNTETYEVIKVDNTNNKTVYACDYVLASEARQVVLTQIAKNMVTMAEYDYSIGE